jgi:hypothetical protein
LHNEAKDFGVAKPNLHSAQSRSRQDDLFETASELIASDPVPAPGSPSKAQGQPAFARHGVEDVNWVAVNPDELERVICVFGFKFLERTIERFRNWLEQDGSRCRV